MPPLTREEELAERLVRIETKMDALIDKLLESNRVANEQRTKLEHTVEDIGRRVTEIERRFNIVIGVLMALNFAAVFLADKIRALFGAA